MSTLIFSLDFILAVVCIVGYLYARSIRVGKGAAVLFIVLAFGVIALSVYASRAEIYCERSEVIAALSLVAALFTACELTYIIHYRKNRIYPESIREAFDLASAGVCYFTENGRVVLCNCPMNEISREIQGTNVLNGFELTQVLKNKFQKENEDTIVLKNERTYKLSFREISVGGKNYTEIMAVDITEIAEKNKALESENERIDRMNAGIREYGVLMDELIREREILNAKIRIHDSFGDLLLTTQRVIGENRDDEVQSLICRWENSLSFLSVREDSGRDDSMENLVGTAKQIDVDIIFDGEIPSCGRANEIAVLAVRECLTNAVKYADSHKLFVKTVKDEKFCRIEIENDGNQPQSEICEGGGLSMLENKVKMAGGSMRIDSLPKFIVSVEIPLELEKLYEAF